MKKSAPRFCINLKAGRIMTRRRFTPQELDELRQLASQWGKIVARRAFGDDGPGLDVDFDALEQIAQAAAAGLTEGTLQTLLERQAAALGEQQPCPECGRLCAVRRHRRPLRTRGAELQQNEPMSHCPDCRRDFFPPAADPAAGRPRL
jgi:hypothetical protein